MNSVLTCFIYKTCAVYLNNIVVAYPTFEQHLMDLEEVFKRLQAAGLSLKLQKCQFCLNELNFLGFRITPSGVKPDQDKIKAVKEFNMHTNVKQVREFLGLTSYYRRFIQNYAHHAEPLHALTRKGATFHWDNNCQKAIEILKGHVTSDPVLSFPDFTQPFFIHTDTCDMGLGAALMQNNDKGYAGHSLHKAELPYCTSEKQCLAVIWALEHFHPYTEGIHVTIFTDHNSLKWLMSRQNPTGQLACSSLCL